VTLLGQVYINLSLPCGEQKRQNLPNGAPGESLTISGKPGLAGGCSFESDSTVRVLFTADAYAPDGRRFTVLADDRPTAFVDYTRRFIVNLNSDENWEHIENKPSKAGWRLGWVSAVDPQVRTIWIADAHRGDGMRFVVHAEEKLTALWNLKKVCKLS